MKYIVIIMAFAMLLFSGCSTMDLGKGSSVATGSAGNDGAKGEAKELVKCQKPVATVEIDTGGSEPAGMSGRQYVVVAQQMGLPPDPLPLVKLMIAQTGCFTVVDRSAGLRAAKREHELAEAGLTRKGSTVKKGQVIEAQYTLQPQILFSEDNAGGGAAIGFVANMFIPGTGQLAAGAFRLKQVQVMITLINNDTLVQAGVSTGSAQSTDVGIGGAFFGGLGGAAGAAFSNTNEGKVVAAALLDAVNKLVPHVQSLQVPQAAPKPQPVAPVAEPAGQEQQPVKPAKAPAKKVINNKKKQV